MDIQALLDALGDPQTRHAALVHFPIALSVLGVLLAGLAAVLGHRHGVLRWVAFGAYALLILVTLTAVKSGEDAEAEVGVLPDRVYAVVEKHEEMAKQLWIPALVTAGLLLASALPGLKGRRVLGGLAVIVAMVAAGWVAAAAHHGGVLVYEEGLGTSVREDASAAAATGEDARLAFFRERVRPVLETRCMRCHNPAKFRGRLDQTTIAGMLKGGKNGPAVVPGRPEESLLVAAIRWEEGLEMPPEDDPLAADVIEDLVEWIRDGAVWE